MGAEKPDVLQHRRLLIVREDTGARSEDAVRVWTTDIEEVGSNGQAFVVYPHRPMILHSPTENSLAVLNHKILEANSQVQNVKLGGYPTCLSINRLWHELCDILCRLVRTTAPGHHDCSIQE
ncbi:uncharacterized protein TNCV_2724961 [Trichonephila clavipes]|nr:uncharacterized protein TNCV_2724961 [Trichonephila clavipes]